MYETGQLQKNIKLEYTKEQRKQDVEERKKNRHKYRHDFTAQLRIVRQNSHLQKKMAKNKFFRDGTSSNFTLL